MCSRASSSAGATPSRLRGMLRPDGGVGRTAATGHPRATAGAGAGGRSPSTPGRSSCRPCSPRPNGNAAVTAPTNGAPRPPRSAGGRRRGRWHPPPCPPPLARPEATHYDHGTDRTRGPAPAPCSALRKWCFADAPPRRGASLPLGRGLRRAGLRPAARRAQRPPVSPAPTAAPRRPFPAAPPPRTPRTRRRARVRRPPTWKAW